jgi:hypothetical protein
MIRAHFNLNEPTCLSRAVTPIAWKAQKPTPSKQQSNGHNAVGHQTFKLPYRLNQTGSHG